MKRLIPVLLGAFLLAAGHTAMAAATADTARAAKASEAADAAVSEAESEEKAAQQAEADAKAAAERAAAAARKREEAAKAAKAAAVAAKERAKSAITMATREGAASCEDWQKERSDPAHPTGTATGWLNGFLAGLEVAKHKDFLQGAKKEANYKWVDNYCHDHPFEFVSDAGIQLYLELARKKGLLD
jgi:glucan-binding YG repeat protein